VKKSEGLLGAVAALLLIGGCISTTTGPPEKSANQGDAAELNYQLGARYYRKGDYDLARDRLELALEQNPKNGLAWSTLGLTYEALVRVAPRDFKIQENYAVFLCRQDRFDDARKYFDKAIKAPTNDYSEQTYTNAGVCMMQKPDNVAAEEYLRAALERRPNYGEALLQMSVLFYETGDNLRARAFLQRYLGSNMPTAPVLFHGIRIEEKLGDDNARREFTLQLLRDFPESAEAERIRQTG
jgi:type IV pilus assembly protein PilF